jgi:hypothetical protein
MFDDEDYREIVEEKISEMNIEQLIQVDNKEFFRRIKQIIKDED